MNPGKTRKPKLAGWLVVVFAAGPLARAEFDPRPNADKAIAQWQKNTGIPVEPEAAKLIRNGVAASGPKLEALAKLQAEYERSSDHLIEMLVRSYCFDLRDAKRRGRRLAGIAAFPRAHAFQASARPSPLRLEANDVRRFSFGEFLAQFFPRMRGVGYLQVKSKPEEAEISIDRDAKGFTNRVFVISPGQHAVLVSSTENRLACNKTIRVEPGRQTVVNCP